MGRLAIRVHQVGKRYRKGLQRHGSVIQWLRRRDAFEYFWALDGVSFEVEHGEMFGIIGPNGAGKSTLLRIISRITRPNAGRVEAEGRIGSLLSVGTGFHPELTGRENVFLNGALIGMHRAEIRRKFDEIVDFSGIPEFIDTPLKRYSSGMTVRLGFAIAAHLEQEILLVDEVLAVGDAAFREKCLRKMAEMTNQGRTVLFVGHNLELIESSCGRAIWLRDGRLSDMGTAAEIVRRYEDETTGAQTDHGGYVLLPPGFAEEDSAIALTHLRLLDGLGTQVGRFRSGEAAHLAIGYRLPNGTPPGEVTVGITLKSAAQHAIASCHHTWVGDPSQRLPERGEFVCRLERLPLAAGRYKLAANCWVGDRLVHAVPETVDIRVVEAEPSRVKARVDSGGGGATLLDYDWAVSAEWTRSQAASLG